MAVRTITNSLVQRETKKRKTLGARNFSIGTRMFLFVCYLLPAAAAAVPLLVFGLVAGWRRSNLSFREKKNNVSPLARLALLQQS